MANKDINSRFDDLLKEVKRYNTRTLITSAITAKSTAEIAGPDDDKQEELLTSIDNTLKEIKEKLAKSVKSSLGSRQQDKDDDKEKEDQKQEDQKSFLKDTSDFLQGMKNGFSDVASYFLGLKKEEEVKAEEDKTQKQEDDIAGADRPDVYSISDDSIEKLIAGQQSVFEKAFAPLDVIKGEIVLLRKVTEGRLKFDPTSTSTTEYRNAKGQYVKVGSERVETNKHLISKNDVRESELSQNTQSTKNLDTITNNLEQTTVNRSSKTALQTEQAKASVDRKVQQLNKEKKASVTGGAVDKGGKITSSTMTIGAPTVTTQSGATLATPGTPVKPNEVPEAAAPEAGGGIMDTISSVASVAGGLLSKGGLGTVAKAGGGLLKGLGSAAKIGGKVLAPLAIASAIGDGIGGYMNANENLDIGDREATTGEKLSSAAGSMVSGLTFGLLDEKKLSKGIANFFGAGPTQPKTDGAELNKESTEKLEMEKTLSSGGGSRTSVNNVVSNNSSQTFVPIRPTPRSHDTSFERYVNRVSFG